jgi:hypothetical protein
MVMDSAGFDYLHFLRRLTGDPSPHQRDEKRRAL